MRRFLALSPKAAHWTAGHRRFCNSGSAVDVKWRSASNAVRSLLTAASSPGRLRSSPQRASPPREKKPTPPRAHSGRRHGSPQSAPRWSNLTGGRGGKETAAAENRPAPMILTRADSGRGSSYSSDDATRRNIAEDADFWGTFSGGVGSRYSGGAAAEHDERSASAPRLGGAVAGVGRVADRLSQALMAAKPPGPPSSRRGPLRTFAAISEEDLTGNEAEASSSEDDVVRAVTKAMHRSGSNKFPHTGLVSAEADDDRALVSEERAQRSATSEPRPSSFTAIPGHANRASLHRSSDSRVPSSRLSDRMHDRAARNRGDALFPAQDDDDHASSNSDSSSSSLNQGKTASRRSSGGSGLRSSLEDARDAVAMLTEALATSETYRSESLDRLARLTPSPGRSSAGPSPSRGGSSGIPSPRVPSPEYWSPDAEARLRREFFFLGSLRSAVPRLRYRALFGHCSWILVRDRRRAERRHCGSAREGVSAELARSHFALCCGRGGLSSQVCERCADPAAAAYRFEGELPSKDRRGDGQRRIRA